MRTCSGCNTKVTDEAAFCPSCGTKQPTETRCLKCTTVLVPDARFCHRCGLPTGTDAPTGFVHETPPSLILDPITTPPPPTGITVEFPTSTAASFEFAVAEARKFASFEQLGEEKKAIFRVNVSQADIDTLSPLLEQLKGWRRRTIYVDGVKTAWDAVFGYSWCYEQKKVSFKPEYYCFGYENEWDLNPWGCIRAQMAFREYADWFSFGRWVSDDGDWEFNKERIRHELEKKLFHVRFCPALKLDLVEAVLSALPNVVNPKKDKNWKFVEAYDGPGIVIRLKLYGATENVTMKCVAPNGKGALEEIAKKVGLRLPV